VSLPAAVRDTTAAFRAVLDSVFAAPDYRWAETPAPRRLLYEWWGRLGDWLAGLRADNPAVFRTLLGVLLLVLLVILAHGAWVVWRTVRGASAPAEGRSRRGHLEEVRDAAWFRREADRAAAQGRVPEALQLAFVALALGLDADGLLSYHPSKTPAECAREARLVGEDRSRLEALVRSLYGCAFGGAACGVDEYRRWIARTAGPWRAAAG
jgi:hypothetical protein